MIDLNSSSDEEKFGMLYDKFTFGNIINYLNEKYVYNSVCEYPVNNLLGNNSENFEQLGYHVDRLKIDEIFNVEKKYDLVWNFCEFENNSNTQLFLKRMINISNKYCLIVTQNKYNVLMCHNIYHLIKRKKWDHGNIENMSVKSVVKVLQKFNNIKIKEIGAFDAPWFIFDFYEGGGFFRKFVPISLLNIKNMKNSIFENMPMPIKLLIAHHHFVMWCVK